MLYVLVFILGTANSPSTSSSVPNLEQNVCNNLKTDINMRMSGKVLYSSCVSQGTQNIIILSREQQQKELDTLMNEAGKNNMIIAPYSFVLDNSGEYWIINHIERRVVDDNYLLPESVGVGYKLPHDKVTLDGSSRKEYINMRTCTFQQLRNFLNYNIDKELSWLPVLDIKGIVQRKPFSFELGTVPNI